MKLTKIILSNIALVLLLLILFEFGVRWIAGETINYQGSVRDIFQDSVYFDSFGLKPNSSGVVFGSEVVINRDGLRDTEKNDNDPRPKILLIGDSVLFGVGITDSLTVYAHLQKYFQDSVNLINTAVIGYGLHDYHNAIRFWLQKDKPVKIYLFYILNDLYSASIDVIQKRPSVLESVFSALRTRSKLYLWIKNGLLNRGKSFFLYDYALYSPSNHFFERAQEKIADIAGICKDLDVPLIVFLLPYRYQYKEDIDDAWKPQRMIKKLWEHHNIMTIDAREAFAVEAVDRFYLYGDPMHLSVEGHQHLAEYIQQTQLKREL